MLSRPGTPVRRIVVLASLLASPLAAPAAWAQEFQPSLRWQKYSLASGTAFADVVFDGRPALYMRPDESAVSRGGPVTVDLTARPIVDILWAARSTLRDRDERQRGNHDFAAKVSFGIEDSDGRRAVLDYVWSSSLPVDTVFTSPFSRVQYVVVQSGPAWSTGFSQVVRDLRADAVRILGMKEPRLRNLRVMSDTDQTGETTEAWYGRIRFLEPPPPEPAPDKGPEISAAGQGPAAG